MKPCLKIILSAFLILFFPFVSCIAQHMYEQVKFMPEIPEGIKQLEIFYNPLSGNLNKDCQVQCIAYLNYNNLEYPIALDINLRKEHQLWKGNIPVSDSTLNVLLVFMDTLGNIDNDGGKGYWTPIYKNGLPLPASLATIARMYTSGWDPKSSFFVERHHNVAKQLYETEFAANPHLKRKFMRYYLSTFDITKQEEKKALKSELDLYAQEKDLGEFELLMSVSKYYAGIGDKDAALKYRNAISERFPNGSWAIQTRSLELLPVIYSTNDQAERKRIYLKFKQTYCRTFPDAFTRRLMTNRGSQMMGKIMELQPGEEIPDFWHQEIDSLKVEFQKYAYFNSARMVMESNNYPLAEKLAEKAVAYQREFMNAPRVYVEQLFISDRLVAGYREKALGEYLALYGRILYQQNKTERAVKVLKEAAVDRGKRKDAISNQYYIESLIKNNQNAEAISEMELAIKSGKVTAAINYYYSRLKANPNAILSLQHFASNHLLEKLKKGMISEKMDDFTFKDRFGKDVYLSDYAGKIIVIDCWATWCAPCIAAFPAMAKLTEKYQSDDVVFLFFDMENADKRDRAIRVFEEMKLQSGLVFDDNNEGSSIFKISGLPTKLVIDRKQTIRFRHAGVSGSMQEQIDELVGMVEMVR